MKTKNFTEGAITKSLLLFALPMIAGNLLQQVYSIVDTLIVGRFIGSDALAAVGATYTLMTFLTSMITGLCMGNGVLFSQRMGAKDRDGLQWDLWLSFWFVAAVTALILVIVLSGTDWILRCLQIPEEICPVTKIYAGILFTGIGFTALYNYFAYLLRSVGNSMVPLYFLVASSLLNVALDVFLVVGWKMGVAGAAVATVISQGMSGIGITIYAFARVDLLHIPGHLRKWNKERFVKIVVNDLMTGMQQSIMNFGILMIQGLVNTFGTIVMAAFAAAVKIDTVAYMPSQEFANAFSLFLSQNFGAGKEDRIREGTRRSFVLSAFFCVLISVFVYGTAPYLVTPFLQKGETAVLFEGVRYLHIEGACYLGIGWLFLLYGYFRAVGKPQISLLLTIVSLGTRVLISYAFAPRHPLGVVVIWLSIPIGWALADLTGLIYMKRRTISIRNF